MFCTLTRRALRRRPVQGIGRTTAHAMLAAFLFITSQVVSAQTAADFEKSPVLNVTQLVPAKLLTGQGFRVEKKVPTDGIMGTYTLIADKETFGKDAGTYQVRSREMLELRLAEIPAIIKLNETSKIGTFAKSKAATAAQPLESAGHMVMNPVDTVTGLPSGVGRLFDRVPPDAPDPSQVGAVEVGDFQFATRRRPQASCDLGRLPIVEIKSGDGKV